MTADADIESYRDQDGTDQDHSPADIPVIANKEIGQGKENLPVERDRSVNDSHKTFQRTNRPTQALINFNEEGDMASIWTASEASIVYRL